MGESRSIRESTAIFEDVELVHADTATDGDESITLLCDGDESNSLLCDPGRNATVLAHNDLAVDGSGVQAVSAGAGHNFRSSTCINMIGAFESFCIPTVWPVACLTTNWGPIQGEPNFF